MDPDIHPKDLVNRQVSPIPKLYLLYLNYTVYQEQEQYMVHVIR